MTDVVFVDTNILIYVHDLTPGHTQTGSNGSARETNGGPDHSSDSC
jgi:hypothetical protein